jgi:hypothetical protein
MPEDLRPSEIGSIREVMGVRGRDGHTSRAAEGGTSSLGGIPAETACISRLFRHCVYGTNT